MIKLKDSFETILGKDATVYTEQERMNRWEEWKKVCLKKKDGAEVVESWSDTSACRDCIHLNKEKSWCNLQGLPCTVNPILSFRMGMVGMACMGIGYEKTNQLELFQE